MRDFYPLKRDEDHSDLIQIVVEALSNRPKNRYPAQAIFIFIADCLNWPLNSRRYREVLTSVKYLIEELVDRDFLEFEYHSCERSYYKIVAQNKLQNLLFRSAGEGSFLIDPHHLSGNEIHAIAGRILAKRVFIINQSRLIELKEQTNNRNIFHKDNFLNESFFTPEDFHEKLYQQKKIIELLSGLFDVSFDVKNDDRGRFYYSGGILSPHSGHLMRWLYKGEDEITLDHRASFAQIVSILYGKSELGARCGIGNNSRDDFYLSILRDVGIDVSKDSSERKIVKSIIMPLAYGESFENAIKKAEDSASQYCIEKERIKLIISACKKFQPTFDKLLHDTRNFATSFTQWGDHPSWKTPSGFLACKKYQSTVEISWSSGGDDYESYYPSSMIFHLRSKNLSDYAPSSTEVKKACVATTANIIQSLDAALLARSVVTFYNRTKEIPFTVHDSYTVSKKNAGILENIVKDEIRKLVNDPEMKILRKSLRIPQSRIERFDFNLMAPLEVE